MIPSVAILAGGVARRLRPVTEDICKSMVDVAGKPFIAHQLDLLKSRGAGKVVICAGYLGGQIKSFVGDGRAFGLSVDYSFDGDRLLGTGGALKKALPLLGDAFFVMYGDSYLDIELAPISEYFFSREKAGLMTVFRNEGNWDRSNVVYENGRIVRYDKENITDDMKYIDYGLALLRKTSFAEKADEQTWDLAELYQDLVGRGEMLGYEVERRFFEIGSFSGLQETRNHIKELRRKKRRSVIEVSKHEY